MNGKWNSIPAVLFTILLLPTLSSAVRSQSTDYPASTLSVAVTGSNVQDTIISARFWSIVIPKATALDVVDMGQVLVSDTKDSLVTAYLTAGNYPVRIDSIIVKPPFSFVEALPSLPSVIPKNGVMSVTFRFIPPAVGNFSDSMVIKTQAETMRRLIRGQGIYAQGTATLRTDTIRAKAGDLVEVPLYLRNVQSVRLNTVFHTELRFNATLLFPMDPTQKGTVANGERRITLDAPWKQTGKEGILTTLRFRAMLGNAEGTPLYVENTSAANVVVTDSSGYFLLTDVCREGGTRLFNTVGSVQLLQNRPNPFNATTVIEYELIENGPTRLSVMDVYGRALATLVDGVMLPGRYAVSFDAGSLASGTYMAVLQTPTMRKFRMLEVCK